MNRNPEQPRKALGRGLSALLPNRPAAAVAVAPPPPAELTTPQTGLLEAPIDSIEPNPLQPRSVFEPEALAELAQSIRANGVIQPLIVQRNGEKYQLVAGERRWKAARMAGLETVPVIVTEIASERLLEIALIENIQREDLNPLEVAHALERLVREYKLSHEEIGQRTGKDRSTVTNLIRLLKLPSEIQMLVAEKKLSMGHARALLALPSEEMQVDFAERAAEAGMSVRQLERHVQSSLGRALDQAQEPPQNDANVNAAINELERILGTRVRIIQQSASRGRLEIEYYSTDDLDRIYNLIIGEN